jgi:hypothetical protein
MDEMILPRQIEDFFFSLHEVRIKKKGILIHTRKGYFWMLYSRRLTIVNECNIINTERLPYVAMTMNRAYSIFECIHALYQDILSISMDFEKFKAFNPNRFDSGKIPIECLGPVIRIKAIFTSLISQLSNVMMSCQNWETACLDILRAPKYQWEGCLIKRCSNCDHFLLKKNETHEYHTCELQEQLLNDEDVCRHHEINGVRSFNTRYEWENYMESKKNERFTKQPLPGETE